MFSNSHSILFMVLFRTLFWLKHVSYVLNVFNWFFLKMSFRNLCIVLTIVGLYELCALLVRCKYQYILLNVCINSITFNLLIVIFMYQLHSIKSITVYEARVRHELTVEPRYEGQMSRRAWSCVTKSWTWVQIEPTFSSPQTKLKRDASTHSPCGDDRVTDSLRLNGWNKSLGQAL
jgi:hypothetical protein